MYSQIYVMWSLQYSVNCKDYDAILQAVLKAACPINAKVTDSMFLIVTQIFADGFWNFLQTELVPSL